MPQQMRWCSPTRLPNFSFKQVGTMEYTSNLKVLVHSFARPQGKWLVYKNWIEFGLGNRMQIRWTQLVPKGESAVLSGPVMTSQSSSSTKLMDMQSGWFLHRTSPNPLCMLCIYKECHWKWKENKPSMMVLGSHYRITGKAYIFPVAISAVLERNGLKARSAPYKMLT